MREIMKPLIPSITAAVVGGFLGWMLQGWRISQENSPRYLDTFTSVIPGVIKPFDVRGHKLSVTLDGKEVTGMSSIDIAIYNQSDKDYSNVPVYVELKPKGGKRPQIVSTQACGAGCAPEALDSQEPRPQESGSLLYQYSIKTANRAENSIFQAKYIIAGDEVPQVDVRVQSPGLRTRDFARWGERNWWEYFLPMTVVILLSVGLYVGFSPILRRLNRKRVLQEDEKLRDLFRSTLVQVANDRAVGQAIDEVKAADRLLMAYQQKRWNEVPKWARWTAPFPRPESVA